MSPDTAPTQLGNYDILSKIAEGGMGTVYKAQNRKSGNIVAVKVIAPATAKNPVLLQRFEREFMAAKVLDHPNVVRAIEYCGSGPHPFLVMEFVDGESLGQYVERQGAFPEAEAVRLIAQVCEGLQRAHKQGLVHRDVKPDNILVTSEGVAKLTDLGLVKDVEGDLNLTKTGRGLGTPHYMAPEQFRNAKGVDIRTDIYSLGATLYAMVTGQVPFENASPLDCWMKKIRNEFAPPKELNPAVSDRVDWAIRRAMSAEPDRRPSSCREFVEDLTGQSRRTPTPQGPIAVEAVDLWYLVYKDETGTAHTVKGTTDGIRKALRDQLLGDTSTILVSRTKTGQFILLANVPEFRDLVLSPAPVAANGERLGSDSGILAKASGLVPRPGPASGRYRRAPDDAVDVGASPPDSGVSSRAGRSASGRIPPVGPASARVTPAAATSSRAAPVARKTPPSEGGRRNIVPTPQNDDPRAETSDYATSTPTNPPSPVRQTAVSSSTLARERSAKKQDFDWTPVVLVVVMLVSAFVGYFILKR